MTLLSHVSRSSLDALLMEIEVLRHNRRYAQILAITSSLPTDILFAQPALVLAHAGSLSYLRRHSEALAILVDGESAVNAARDERTLASWQLLYAIQLLHGGRVDEAKLLLFNALALGSKNKILSLTADASNTLGVCCSFHGDVEEAVLLFKRSLVAWKTIGEARGVAFAHHNIGVVLREWGRPRQAEPHFQQADLYYNTEGIVEERICILAERSILYGDLGDARLATTLAARALACSETVGAPAVRASALRAWGLALCRAESLTEGEAAIRNALSILGDDRAGLLRAELLEELAVMSASRGAPSARDFLEQAIGAYSELGSVRHKTRLVSRFGRCFR